ncbi:tRNA adenosine(34) deaminase TadA [Alkaliphilus sp. B6464]|uniref:tRNA adenosine(34) deaminase TadA n=1 Tax=Alkaliphilus sp. B6464 TaxID=2731219 RepID=UPI002ED18B07
MEEKFMLLAIEEAKKAFNKKEVPIGAIIVKQNKVIARAHNLREISKNAISHAELIAIQDACNLLGGWRLTDCTLYVTIEPCPMCAGAILQSRIKKVVIGAMDAKAGACGSILNLLNNPKFNHQTEIQTGVLEEECSQLMKNFFRSLREKH